MKTQSKASSVKSSEAKQKKIDAVSALSEKAARSKVTVLADYRGLKHKQLEELRRTLKKTDGEFVVAKNRLVKRMLADRAEGVSDSLKESTAVLFAYADEVAPLKEMLKFFKGAGVGKAKAGLMGDTVMSEAELKRLAALPSREVLLGMLTGQLQAPIRGLHYALSWNIHKLVWALNAVKGKKG